MKFLSYRNTHLRAGLSHQQSNLTAMLREAYLGGRTLILPEFRLAGKHNAGRHLTTRFAEYFDLDNVTVDGAPVMVVYEENLPGISSAETVIPAQEDIRGRPETHVAKDLNHVWIVRVFYEFLYGDLGKLPVHLDIHPALRNLARANREQIPGNAAWVHARRGDLVHVTQIATSPVNIRRTVRNADPAITCLYIATNEPEPSFFDPLREHFTVLTQQDIPDFAEAGRGDNYRLFLAEKHFAGFFPVRISTFQTGNPFYQAHLCREPGYQ